MIPEARAESFNIKPGVWEMTTTTVALGMKARKGKPHRTTMQSCLTKDDVSQNRIIKEMEDEDEDSEVHCKVNVISKSSSKLIIDKMCPGPSPSTTRFTIHTKTPDSLVATGERVQQGSGKSRVDIKGRWIEAGCEGMEE